MKCPFCNNLDTKVVDSRAMDEKNVIRRRRHCEECEKRFTTYERIENVPIIVIKSNGDRETFDRDKLFGGIMKSCNKRPISLTQIEQIVDEIENSADREISSKALGEMVMDKLKNVDQVAYVRFASVYRQFKDIDTFMNELSKLLSENEKE